MSGVYILVDAYDQDDIKIATYKSKALAQTAVRAYMRGQYNIQDDEIDDVVKAVFDEEYGAIMCVYRPLF